MTVYVRGFGKEKFRLVDSDEDQCVEGPSNLRCAVADNQGNTINPKCCDILRQPEITTSSTFAENDKVIVSVEDSDSHSHELYGVIKSVYENGNYAVVIGNIHLRSVSAQNIKPAA